VLLFAGPARTDTLDEIKKRGEMVIGMEAAYVPYESGCRCLSPMHPPRIMSCFFAAA
jgi:hypothetical protein